jgi:gamma-glutamyl-gamma-aminobutyrate hydrolase PuuD
MKTVAVTQRVSVVPSYGERRDCLDQAWTKFLAACGLSAVLHQAERRRLPILGVCRGMQVIQRRFAIRLRRVEGHVTPRQVIHIDGQLKEVNSYHRFAAFNSRPPLNVWAVAEDGVVKAIRHSIQPITGIMWHPERCAPFSSGDLALFRQVFAVE